MRLMHLYGPEFPFVHCPGWILRDVMTIPRMPQWQMVARVDEVEPL